VKTKLIPSGWIEKEGRRLDCGPYLSGAIEAKLLLEKLAVPKELLQSLTLGGRAGVFHAGRESRTWVEDPTYGVPFLSSSDVLMADLSRVSLISRKQIVANPKFILHNGWTLITRSGTIGRMAYCRPDMEGYACSEHILRVAPDESKILPGYLFAFLASRYGLPMVVGGTYGSIIQAIEPEHIWNLPVPRLGEKRERAINHLIERAAVLRAQAPALWARAKISVEAEVGWKPMPLGFNVSSVRATSLQRRFDAFHFSLPVHSGRNALAQHELACPIVEKIECVIEPNRGARLKVEDPQFGVPFLSSSEVFSLTPRADYLISKRTSSLDTFILSDRDLLLPRSGQVGGLIGRAVLPVSQIAGMAGSEHLIRLRCRSKEDAAYLWAVLSSGPGYLAVVGTAFGSSIPSLDRNLVGALKVPWLRRKKRAMISEYVMQAQASLEEAIALEEEGINLVSRIVGELGSN
jgi:type I restriction enzyme S subunit